MLLEGYRLEIFNSECNPGAMAVHCFAHLDQDVSKLLPKTNCRMCGEPTCMVFAARLAEGAKGIEKCPPLIGEKRRQLEDYIQRFDLSQ